MEVDVAIVGAGITGLSAAFTLHRAGHRVVVLEREAAVGGTMRTEPASRTGGFVFEWGPRGFLDNRSTTRELIVACGADTALVRAARAAQRRAVLLGDRLVYLSPDPRALARLLGVQGLLRLALEPLRPSEFAEGEPTLAEVVEARLGSRARAVLAEAFVAGIYAGRADQLGIVSAFGTFGEAVVRHGSLLRAAVALATARRSSDQRVASKGFSSFREGMGTLPETLAQALEPDAVRTGTHVELVEPASKGGGWRVHFDGGPSIAARAVFLAVPAYWQARLLRNVLDAQSIATLTTIRYAPVAVVGLGWQAGPRAPTLPAAFGFLVPPDQGTPVLGCLFDSSMFEGRCPVGGASLSAFVGGARAPHAVGASRDELVQEVLRALERARVLPQGQTGAPDAVFVRRWQRAIPQYEPGHARRVQGVLDDISRWDGLSVGGNWQGGVSVHDCIATGLRTARRLGEFLRGKTS